MLSHVQFFVTHGLKSARLLWPWDLSGKNIGMDCHFLLQGIFLSQGSNSCLLCFLYWHEDYLPLICLQFSSVAQSCPSVCDPMNHSTPGLPVHHQLPEFTQTHVHRVGDAIQPSQSSVVPFSSCPQSLPASKSFQMSHLFS